MSSNRQAQLILSQSSFLLLCRPAPNSFVLVTKTDSAVKQRFRVVIGPQLCSCRDVSPSKTTSSVADLGSEDQDRPICCHLLFVMVKLLKVGLNDNCLFEASLPASKAEQLIQTFTDRLTNTHQSNSTLHLVLPKPNRDCSVTRRSQPQSLRIGAASGISPSQLLSSPESSELVSLVDRTHLRVRRFIASAAADCLLGTHQSTCVDGIQSCQRGENVTTGQHERPSTVPQLPTYELAASGQQSERSARASSLRHTSSTTFRPIHGDKISSELDNRNGEGDEFIKGRLVSCRGDPGGCIQSSPTSSFGDKGLQSHIHLVNVGNEYSQAMPLHSDGDSQEVERTVKGVDLESYATLSCIPTTALPETTSVMTSSTSSAMVVTESFVDDLNTSKQSDKCLLCFEPIDQQAAVIDDQQVTEWFRCILNEEEGLKKCGATFHATCLSMYLAELHSDGDKPCCPICSCLWIAIPELPSSTTPSQDSSSNPNMPSPSAVKSDNIGNATVKCNGPGQITSIEHSSISQPVSEPPYPDYESCASAFSKEIADGLACRDSPSSRQAALRNATRLTLHRIVRARHERQQMIQSSSSLSTRTNNPNVDTMLPGNQSLATAPNGSPSLNKFSSNPSQPDCLRVMFRLIRHSLDDPDDDLFSDALQALQDLLAYLVCPSAETQTALQRAIGPIFRRLLRFVGGSSELWASPRWWTNAADKPEADLANRSSLALTSLIELAKGQAGSFAVGRELNCVPTCLPVCSLQHMARFVLSSAKFHATHLVGRLTLLEHLIEMDRSSELSSTTITTQSTVTGSSNRSLARRHLCSSLVFARRHLLPLTRTRTPLATETPNHPSNHHQQQRRFANDVCYPYHYKFQSTGPVPDHIQGHVENGGTDGGGIDYTPGANFETNGEESLYNMQLKASRLARKVFLAAARALLTYPINNQSTINTTNNSIDSNAVANVVDSSYGSRDFNALDFVQSELQQISPSVASWLHTRLRDLLTSSSSGTFDTNYMSTDQPTLLVDVSHLGTDLKVKRVQTLTKSSDQCHVIQLSVDQQSSATTTVTPPAPPPRRNCPHPPQASSVRSPTNDMDNIKPSSPIKIVKKSDELSPSKIAMSRYLRIALEPAYDVVALSESEQYSSQSEEEEDVYTASRRRRRHRTHNENLSNEPVIYAGRSLTSEAELQSEQVSTLKSALKHSYRTKRVIFPVPGLSSVMKAFQSTSTLPNSDEYYESIDWLKGPMLGCGAFGRCYQARDTRTGLLMAVKRIPLGRASVLPIVTDNNNNGGLVSSKIDPELNCKSILGKQLLANIVAEQPHGNNNSNDASSGIESANSNNRATGHQLSPTAAAQLADVGQEVATMLRLRRHANILHIFGAVYCSRRGLVDIFMEWMPGGSVTSMLKQYGPFNESVTRNYGVQVVRGLSHLHQHGILHRDLKGANLLLDASGSIVRISDFGASTQLSGEESVAGQFCGQVIGTFAFMAPEVLRGETYGRACDIWSVGCCLVEMLTGRPPWKDNQLTNRYALIFKIATSQSPPVYPDNTSSDLIQVLDACFLREARQRPTAKKLLTYPALARLTNDAVVATSPNCHSYPFIGTSRPRDELDVHGKNSTRVQPPPVSPCLS